MTPYFAGAFVIAAFMGGPPCGEILVRHCGVHGALGVAALALACLWAVPIAVTRRLPIVMLPLFAFAASFVIPIVFHWTSLLSIARIGRQVLFLLTVLGIWSLHLSILAYRLGLLSTTSLRGRGGVLVAWYLGRISGLLVFMLALVASFRLLAPGGALFAIAVTILAMSVVSGACGALVELWCLKRIASPLPPELSAAISRLNKRGLEEWPRTVFLRSDGVPICEVRSAFFMPATLLVNNSVVDMLSAEDLDAALAHEYAHVVLRHGRMSRAGTWVPFVLMLLVMLLAGVMPQHRGQPASAFEVASVALIWFCVNSAVLALMRLRHEVEADEYASQVVGRDAMARVLVRVMGTQLLSAGLLSRLNVRVRVRRLEDAP